IFGQNNIEEVVYLKNGSIIRGTIIEQVPNQTLKIQTKDGSVFVFNLNEVQKITKEAPYKNPAPNPVNTNTQVINQSNNENIVNNTVENTYSTTDSKEKKEYLKKGFIGITEIGAIGRKQISPKSAFTLHQFIGKRTSQHFAIGVDFGVEVNKSLLVVPVMLDTRIYFLNKRITPFLNLAPGYAFSSIPYYDYNSYYGGYGYYKRGRRPYHSFITNFGIGVEYKVNEKIGVTFSTGGRLSYFPKASTTLGNGFFKIGIEY
ncbi:MAG: hypothetical protein KDC72_04190, partial [Bacteroidetes bacterium]|nr:hypothetical protein [Bacteroidota bacterium]